MSDYTEAIENLLTLSGVPFKKKEKVEEKKEEAAESPKEESTETPAEEKKEDDAEPEEGNERDDASARPGSVEESFLGKKKAEKK